MTNRPHSELKKPSNEQILNVKHTYWLISTMANELTLRVGEASPKDVARGFARVDPADMEHVDADVGEIITITGKRTTVAKLMPTHFEARGEKSIQIDGIIRENAGAGIGDHVKIAKTSENPATAIVLSGTASPYTRYVGQFPKLLEGLPVVKDDIVRILYFGTHYQEYKVKDTVPSGAVIIRADTQIQLKTEKGEAKTGGKVSYEDVGGIGKELKKIREMIELPLRHPGLFQHLGIDPPKGILLYGPPGTGKTLIAKAIANETSATFMHVNGPEIMHKFYGESEGRLREVFADASTNAPSILFIDEIDAIAPKREKVVGDVEKRVVGQLLALMDGLESRGQVVVIGATNIPNALDPALRRPGRFDREIIISVPDRNAREEILNIHTRGMPLDENVDINKLADVTHGFVGADLAALCREAAMNAIRTIMPDVVDEVLSPEIILGMEVTMDDFLDALREIRPSTIREVFVETPDVRWEDVGALEKVKQDLKQAIEWPLEYSELFGYSGIKPPKGVLLYGPPGTGKTLLTKAVASEINANFISIKGPELLSKWVGESESKIREIFLKARQAAPCVVFFDEIDAIAPKRGTGAGDSHVSERVVSQLLTEMDGIEELRGVTVIAATNRIDIIDQALLRSGRFDRLIEIQPPNEEELEQIFAVHARKRPLDNNVNRKALARSMVGFTGADVESVTRDAALLVINEYINANKDVKRPDFTIEQRHFVEAIDQFKKTRQKE
ncbi:MAG: CDC48 family AAA ATPase [Euryarchaeota archaeon]